MGETETACASVEAPPETIVEFEPETLRLKARQALIAGVEDGDLSAKLDSDKAEQRAQQLDALRLRATQLLSQSAVDGTLAAILQEEVMMEEKRLETQEQDALRTEVSEAVADTEELKRAAENEIFNN